MEERHNNSDCGRGAELLAYLYGETGAKEARAFEAHIDSCRSCADESSDFLSVRGSLAAMRSDFDRLPTPRIVIPYPVRDAGSEPVSILDSIRAFLAGFPAFTVGAAAAVLIFIGVGFYYLTADRGNDIAGGNQNRKSPIASPTVDPAASRTPEPATIESRDPSAQSAPAPVKASDRRSVTQPKTKPEARRASPNGSKKPKQNAPIFEEDEEQDDTLRLADLFGDIGTE